MSFNNARVPPSSCKGENRSSITSAGEGAQAGPAVPPRPVRRNGLTDRLSKFEKSTATTNKDSKASRSSVRTGPEPRKTISPTQPQQVEKVPKSNSNNGIETQVQEQEQKTAKLKARAECAEAEVRKLKGEKEQLQADLACKTQKAAGLKTRVMDMANCLLQADEKIKNLERKAVLADELNTKLTRANQQISELNDVVQVRVPAALESTSSAPGTPTGSSRLSEENENLRERLEIVNAKLKLANKNIEYKRKLENVNASINTQYAAVVSTFAAKESQIAELQTQLDDLQRRYDDLEDKADYETLELRAEYLQEECRKLQRERDRVEFNALHGFGQFAHLKQKPAQKLGLVLFSAVETAPVAASEPKLDFYSHNGVFTEPAALLAANLAASEVLVLANPSYTPPPTLAESVAPVKPAMIDASAQTLHLLNDIQVTININADDKKKMGLLKRMQAALSKKSAIDVRGPPQLVTEMWKAMEELEQDHVIQLTKVIELRAFLRSQAQEIEFLEQQNARKVQQLKSRHCLVAEHRYLADHVAAMQDRLDMQATLLAQDRLQEEHPVLDSGPAEPVTDNLLVPIDDNLWA